MMGDRLHGSGDVSNVYSHVSRDATVPSDSTSASSRHVTSRSAASAVSSRTTRVIDDARLSEERNDNGETVNAFCARHPSRTLAIFCSDCTEPMCESCFILRHNGHRYASVDDVAARLRAQLADVEERIERRAVVLRGRLGDVERSRLETAASAETAETAIREAVTRLQAVVDVEAATLHQRLEAGRNEAVQRAETARDELQRQLESLDALTRRCAKLKTSASAVQLLSVCPTVLSDVNQLENVQPSDICDCSPTTFQFTESTFRHYVPDSEMSLVGRIDSETEKPAAAAPSWSELKERVADIEQRLAEQSTVARDSITRLEDELNLSTRRETELRKQLTATELKLKRSERLLLKPVRVTSIHGPRGGGSLTCNAGVRGISLLDGLLYVLHVGRRTIDIAVHDVSTAVISVKQLATVVHRLTVDGLRDAADMAACRRYRCLYVTDVEVDLVHRLDVSENDPGARAESWPVGDKPWGVSVTAASSVLVACFLRQKLKEFTSHGQQLRLVSLHPDIGYPWHAVEQQAGGRVAVCHGGVGSDGRRVCLVGRDGRAAAAHVLPAKASSSSSLSAASSSSGCTSGYPSSPLHAVVDLDQFVIVLDCDNRRLSLLDSELAFIRDAAADSSTASVAASSLKDPRRICWDGVARRMYVGDGNGNVLVFELK